MTDNPSRLKDAFADQPILCLPQITEALGCSRRTAIRALQALGYLSSYSHAGKFYTLPSLARFDAFGLWHNRDIHFSCWGSLKNTAAQLVERSSEGYDHGELHELTQVRCYNALLDLTTRRHIHREAVGPSRGAFYFSIHEAKRAQQLQQRQRRVEQALPPTGPSLFPPPPIEPSRALAVVVEVVRKPQASPAVIAHALGKDYGLEVPVAQVRQVFQTYDLSKKGAP